MRDLSVIMLMEDTGAFSLIWLKCNVPAKRRESAETILLIPDTKRTLVVDVQNCQL